jgi:hypothetical protein
MTSPTPAAVMTVWCGFCWTGPDTPCAPEGQHFDRYMWAAEEGLISRKAVRNVCIALGPVSAGTLVPDTPTLVAGGPAA